jgi:hypothetical protein
LSSGELILSRAIAVLTGGAFHRFSVFEASRVWAQREMPSLACVMRTLLFFRDYRAFQGGHLKVADYIAHTRSSGLFTPQLFMTPESLRVPLSRDVIVRD